MATEKKVKKDDLITVVGTGKVPFLPKGEKQTVHRIAGEKLIASGKAELVEEKASKK